MAQHRRLDRDLVLSALSHPVRVEILRRSVKPTSSKQIADATGEPIGNVSYHARALIDAGLLETVETGMARGALVKYNRRTKTAKRAVREASDALRDLADAL